MFTAEQTQQMNVDGIKAFRKKHSNISRTYCYNIKSDWLIYFQPIRFTEMIKLISRQSEDNFHNTWAFQFLNITAWPVFPALWLAFSEFDILLDDGQKYK